MSRYVLGIFVPMVSSIVWLCICTRIANSVRSRYQPDVEHNPASMLPSSGHAHMIGAIVAGALTAVGYFLLNKEHPGTQAAQCGFFWISYMVALRCGVNRADTGRRALWKRNMLVLVLPFAASIWGAAAVLSLAMRS